MIAIESAGVVLITPPKTASTALHLELCKPGGPGVEIQGPLPGNPIDIEAHTFMIPRRFHGYRAAVVMRNPYARARSLFNHARRWAGFRGNFRAFVHGRLIGKRSIWWHWPAITFGMFATEPLGIDLHILQLENLAADLAEMGVPCGPLAIENANGNATAEPPADWIDRSMVNIWAADDFAAGGYEIEPAQFGPWEADLQPITRPPWKYENHTHREGSDEPA